MTNETTTTKMANEAMEEILTATVSRKRRTAAEVKAALKETK